MEIKHKLINRTLQICLCGELDETAAENARTFLDMLIDKKLPEKIIFDLSRLTFMDSTGIGVLLGRYKRCKNLNINVLIASPHSTVDKLLTLSGIYTVIPKIS